MKYAIPFACLAVAWFAVSVPAFAGDDDDPAALLRKAAVAQDVDRDAAKALALYRKVVEIGGTSVAARDALFKVADLTEAKGDKPGALEALRALTERFASSLDADGKRLIHESMIRLVPPGGRARSPLGEIYVRAESGAGAASETLASPLDAKVDALLAKLDGATPSTLFATQNEVRSALTPVGRDALEALERAMMGGKPQRASFAAQLYGEIGAADAVPGLARAIRNGDGFTRGAALYALGRVVQAPETNAAIVVAVDRLLGVAELAGRGDSLKSILAPRLTPEQLMERHRLGGAEGLFWLRAALQRKAPGALEKVLELIKKGGPDAGALASSLAPLIAMPGTSPNRDQNPGPYVYSADALDRSTLLGLIDVLIGQGVDRDKVRAIGQLARLAAAKAPPAEQKEAASSAWAVWKRLPDEETKGIFVYEMLMSGVEIPGEVFADSAMAPSLFFNFTNSMLTPRLITLGASDGPFWDALVSYLRGRPWMDCAELLQYLVPRRDSPLPPRIDKGWIALLGQDSWSGANQLWVHAFAYAAARSGDPAFLDLLRKRTFGNANPTVSQVLKNALESYHGPGLLAFCLEALKEPAYEGSQGVQRILAALPEPEARKAIVATARDRASPNAPRALETLAGTLRAKAEIVAILETEATSASPGPDAYREALITVSRWLHLQEAAPFLLREYKDGTWSGSAGAAMTEIRDFHERLAKFQSWSTGAEAGKKDLAALLHDDDPEIRRAAVLSIAAMGDTDALPTLVKIAKEDKDPRVRAAVFEAVERLAKESSKRPPKDDDKPPAPAGK